MRCLAGMECENVPFKSLNLENLPGQGRLPFFYRWLAQAWNRKWSLQRPVFNYDDMDEAYVNYWKEHKTKIEIKKYEKDELESLLKSTKVSRTTLTAYLITEMIKDSGQKFNVGLAVDGRQDNNRSMGNQATGISIQYRYDRKKSFDDNARAVHRLMKKSYLITDIVTSCLVLWGCLIRP